MDPPPISTEDAIHYARLLHIHLQSKDRLEKRSMKRSDTEKRMFYAQLEAQNQKVIELEESCAIQQEEIEANLQNKLELEAENSELKNELWELREIIKGLSGAYTDVLGSAETTPVETFEIPPTPCSDQGFAINESRVMMDFLSSSTNPGIFRQSDFVLNNLSTSPTGSPENALNTSATVFQSPLKGALNKSMRLVYNLGTIFTQSYDRSRTPDSTHHTPISHSSTPLSIDDTFNNPNMDGQPAPLACSTRVVESRQRTFSKPEFLIYGEMILLHGYHDKHISWVRVNARMNQIKDCPKLTADGCKSRLPSLKTFVLDNKADSEVQEKLGFILKG